MKVKGPKKGKQIISLLLVMVLLLSLTQGITVQAAEEAPKSNCVTYDGNDYQVIFEVTNQWQGGFNANVKITNTGKVKIDNWAIGFVLPYEIANIWNGIVKSDENGNYIIKNSGSNQDIEVGQSVSFGFNANGSGELMLPKQYELLCQKEEVAASSVEISCNVTNDWKSAFNGEIVIKNCSEETIEDWSLEFDYIPQIETFWTAHIVSQDGQHYVIENAGYNANIKPGESLSLGYRGNPGDVTASPENYKVSQVVTKKPAVDLNKDTDGDKIPDYNEEQLGTDKTKADTDGDGLDDYIELTLGYSPIKADTDNNGVNDGQEDYDQDGLTNIEEVKLGTDLTLADTDGDGLNDEEEVNRYFTDPNVADTDGDGLLDGEEIKYGLNPLLKDSDNDGIEDSRESLSHDFDAKDLMDDYDEAVYPMMKLEGTCETLSSFEMNVKDSSYIMNQRIPGYIGSAYEFHADGKFESAEVTFELGNKVLQKSNFKPAIYYFNEKEQRLEKVENQVIKGNTVSAPLQHFSSYIVLNEVEFDKVWDTEIVCLDKAEEKKALDLALVIDASGSMDWNDRYGLRLDLSKQMIAKLKDKDRGLVVSFENTARLLQSLTADKNALITAINRIYSGNMTAMCDGIKVANNNLISKSDKDHRKIMIVLTDGLDNYSSYSTSDVVNQAKANDIIIYTIGLGDDLNEAQLKSIASNTGGKYYYASVAGDLEDIYKDIEDETVDYKTDSNNDGISDYHTKLLCDGTLKTGNGISVFEGIPYEEIQKNADYDGDGLKNGEEIVVTAYGKTAYVKMKSSPTTAYTDNDVYTDYDEVKKYNTDPMESNVLIEESYINKLSNGDYYYAASYEDQYLSSTSKQICAWIGNNIFGSNYDESEIYKDALIKYFKDMNNDAERKSAVHTYAQMIQQYGYEVSQVLEQGRATLQGKGEAIDRLLDLEKQTEHLKASIAEMERSSNVFSKADFYKQYDSLQSCLKTAAQESDDIKAVLNTDVTVKGKLTAFSQGKTASKISKSLSWGCNILQEGLAIADGINDYSDLKANLDIMQSNIYILDVLASKAYYDNLKDAADSLAKAARRGYASATEEILQSVTSATVNIALHTAIAAIPVVGFWTELALSVVNIIIPVSDSSLYAVRLCGDSCIATMLASDLKSSMAGDIVKTSSGSYAYAVCEEEATEAVQKYMNLVEMRKFGENDMITLQDMGPGWLNWICDLLGNDSKGIISDCKDTIEYLDGIKYRYCFKCY